MIRLEPSLVMKYVEGLDAFVKFRIFSQDDLKNIFHDARISDRRSYMQLVLERCVVQLPGDGRTKLEGGGEGHQRLRDLLYEVCVSLNPGLDINKVIVPLRETSEVPLAGRALDSARAGAARPLNVAELSAALARRVLGQEEAVQALASAVARAHAGLRDTRRPIGTFLFLGQTGVGKTEMAKALAEELARDDRKALVRIDCSEYSLPHEYAKLIGAPPGYVGYDQGGFLSSVMAEAEAGVVLFDEIEKADEKVHHLLLQIMDEGYVTDAKGVKIDFTDSLIVLTSNLGAGEADALQRRLGFGMAERKPLGHAERVQATRDAMRRRFKPEFLNRIDETIVFQSLTPHEGGLILDKFAAQLAARARRRGLRLEMSARARAWLLDRGFSHEFGAREIRRTVQRDLETPLADALLSGRIPARGKVVADIVEGLLVFHGTPARARARHASRGGKRVA